MADLVAKSTPASMVKVANKAEYKLEFDNGLSCHIGEKDDVSGGKFLPVAALSKWGDASMKIQDTSVSISNEKESFDGSTVELGVGGIKHRFYKTDVAIPHFPGGFDEALEWEMEFSSPPTSPTISFDVEFSPGLRFCYQGELTQEEINDGAVRADEVTGSYAVYWKEKHNQYKTGKFCHIYRPKLTDDAGKWTWAEIHIDPIQKKLTYTIDLAWLATAQYPVVLGGTKLGKTDIGGSEALFYDDYEYAADVGTAVSGGSIDNLAWYNSGSGEGAYKLMLYDDDSATPDALVEYSTEQSTFAGNSWNIASSANLTQGYSIVSGQRYWVGVWLSGPSNCNYAYDADASYEGKWRHGRNYSDTTPSNPFKTDTHVVDGNQVSCYVEYTAAATPPSGGSGMSLPLRQIVIRRK